MQKASLGQILNFRLASVRDSLLRRVSHWKLSAEHCRLPKIKTHTASFDPNPTQPFLAETRPPGFLKWSFYFNIFHFYSSCSPFWFFSSQEHFFILRNYLFFTSLKSMKPTTHLLSLVIKRTKTDKLSWLELIELNWKVYFSPLSPQQRTERNLTTFMGESMTSA